MRSVINVSLPKQMEDIVVNAVKRGNYASKSEFFRHLLRDYIEKDLSRELEKSHRELASGKGKILKSLRDLR